MILAGRGFGKTRSGAEWVLKRKRQGFRRIALVAPDSGDARDVIVEGVSGILACSPPWDMPHYEPSKRRLTWANGARATLYSAEEPNSLRGPAHDTAWADEVAAYSYPDTFDQLQFGLRIGRDPRLLVTTTPRPTPQIKSIIADARTVVTTGSTFENKSNLAEAFLETITARYEGTRIGRQELYAEILDDVQGALWTRAMLEATRLQAHPALVRVVVAIDPAVSNNEGSDEVGIIVVGLGVDGRAYVLADLSGRMSPLEWATVAINALHQFNADRIIAEANNGGNLVEANLRAVNRNTPYRAVHASQGKRTRAEPIAALYEQQRVSHVGIFPALETQMTSWEPLKGGKSPDRMDALVWGLTEIMPLGPSRQRRIITDYEEAPGWE